MDLVEAPTRLTGGCQCGGVRYVLTARPTGSSICHCRMCQKAGGAPFMAFTGMRQKHFAFTRGALRSTAVRRSPSGDSAPFAARC